MNSKTLTHSTLWNLLGQGLPLVVGIFMLPIIIRGLGTERFGVFTLMTAIYTYFNLFDLGIGFALIHHLSAKLNNTADRKDVSILVWSAFFLLILLSGFAVIFLFFILGYLLSTLNFSASLYGEIRTSFFLLLLITPFNILGSGLRAILQAHQRFDLANKIQMPLAILTLVIPVLILPFNNTLMMMMLVLCFIQLIALGLLIKGSCDLMPYVFSHLKIRKQAVKLLLSFGGWLTVSNVLNPFMIYIDRFFLGRIMPINSIVFYTTPFDATNKLLFIPSAVSGPLFARFSEIHMKNKSELGHLFHKGVKFIFITVFPIVFILFVFTKELLSLWLGLDFATQSTWIMRWLLLGTLVYSLSFAATHLIVGVGKTYLTARVHLFELPLYILTLFILVQKFGMGGAAITFFLRVFLEWIVFLIITVRLTEYGQNDLGKSLWAMVLFTALLISSAFLVNTCIKFLFLVFTLIFFAFLCRFLFLTQEDRKWVMHILTGK